MYFNVKGKTKEGYSCANILTHRAPCAKKATRFEFAASLIFKFYIADFFAVCQHRLLTQDDS
jgi:hypothetical protein